MRISDWSSDVCSSDLLSILRFAQGLALGGSWDGLPSLLALNAPQNRRGWYAMIPQLGAPLGFMLAAALFAFLYASLKEADRSEEHTSELQSLMRSSYAVFCLKKKKQVCTTQTTN